jgi:hypothetical protein
MKILTKAEDQNDKKKKKKEKSVCNIHKEEKESVHDSFWGKDEFQRKTQAIGNL